MVNCSEYTWDARIGVRKYVEKHCGNCDGIKCDCVSDLWLSTTTPGSINATQICIEQGYTGDILEIGGNGGYLCNYPIDLGQDSKESMDKEKFESPVSWLCKSGTVFFIYTC